MWSSCSLIFSLDLLFLPSGVRWPAWSRVTAASLSSAPPPPPPVNLNPARWSPGRSWIINPPHPPTEANFLSCPSSTSLDSVPIAQPVSNRTEACLHKQKTKNKKNLRQKNKEKQRPCTILKGWFLHKGHIFFMPGTWAGQQFESEISRMFVCAVSHVGGKVKGREMRCVCLCGSGSWKKQYSHPGSYGTEWTHWRRCYIYAFTSAPTEYSTETTHTSFLCARWKNWMCCYIQTPLHMHTNIQTFEDMQKFTVFAILPEGFVQIWWIVYRSKCLWAV